MSTHALRLALLFSCLASLASMRAEESSGTPAGLPRFRHPGSGQVYYFVLPDRFANGNPENDRAGLPGGRDVDGFDPAVISHFHGGDLSGLSSRLDYILGLGTTALWITPPFVNKAVQRGSAAYHGYWINDFTAIDPHLGTEAEFREFVSQAHHRGIKLCLDIVVNHSADVIRQPAGARTYLDVAGHPYRDATGRAFDIRAAAYNGLGDPGAFPFLDPARSFAYAPELPEAERDVKRPAWLNDTRLYHNRGHSTFVGESSQHGDFGGLDDLMTEHPTVVNGFIDVYRRWIRDFSVDAFRIDTVKHVNIEFWEAFSPAMREQALASGRPGFFEFGEVADETGDLALLSEFSTRGGLDAPLDFGLYRTLRRVISEGRPCSELATLLEDDDWYTDHDSNADGLPTFVSNHDAGRLGYYLRRDTPGLGPELQQRLVLLAHGLLFTLRGQPVVYYGEEQGMSGTGDDMRAREDMFASKADGFRDLSLLGTTRRGSDDKFDENHPLYQAFRSLSALRLAHPGLLHGATLPRSTASSSLIAFSRVERRERIEYLVVANTSRTETLACLLPTSQAPGAVLLPVYDSTRPGQASGRSLRGDAQGRVSVSLAPLQLMVWKAARVLPVPASAPRLVPLSPLAGSTLAFGTREIVGHRLVLRQEISAAVEGGDGVGELSFLLERASRPGQYELLGVDDSPPYRVFWQPPADLGPEEEFTLVCRFDDLRGHRTQQRTGHLRIAAGGPETGIRGATVPRFTRMPPARVSARKGTRLEIEAAAEGTGPLEYQWYHDGTPVAGATKAVLRIDAPTRADAGRYTLLVHNRASSTLCSESLLSVE